MEKRADQLALNEQVQEGVYARALEKLYRENKIPAVNVNDKQTHPHLYDRMVAAGGGMVLVRANTVTASFTPSTATRYVRSPTACGLIENETATWSMERAP